MSSPNSLGRRGHPFMGHLCLWSQLRDNEIRVYGMPPPGAKGLAYIALQEAPQPSDQTDLDQRLFINPQRRWRHDPRDGACLARLVGGAPMVGGGRPTSGPIFPSVYFQSLLVPSRLQKSYAWPCCLYVNLTCGPSLVLFSWHPVETNIHQNSWNYISKPPISKS
jgi:hypothetical protein